MYMIGWGDSEEGVKERITSNRALLAGIYSLTDGVEDLLAEHRRCQREAGRTRANKSDSVQAQREKDIWWTSLQGGTVTAEESVDSVPEGLMKESKNADDFENVMEKEVVEKRKETVNVTYESEVRIGVDVGAKKVVPKVQRGWSPGMSVVGLDVAGLFCLDAGQSTGGFTDVLLGRGAARVVGFDVGHSQLNQRVRCDARVVALEGLHIRELAGSALAEHVPEGGFGLVVADLSFISLAGALSHLAPWLKPGGDALLLAKPQFEVGRANVGKGGIVKDAAQIDRLEAIFRDACGAVQWTVRDYFASPVTGGDGNPEFFVWAQSRALENA